LFSIPFKIVLVVLLVLEEKPSTTTRVSLLSSTGNVFIDVGV